MDKFDFDIVRGKFDKLVKAHLPTKLANIGRNFFAASWRKQGWDDGGVQPWKEVQRRIEDTKAWKYPKKKGLGRRTRAINVKSGDLRRAVQDSAKDSISAFHQNRLSIRFLVDIPYAGYINDGTEKDGGHLPARPFMKDSATLNKLIEDKIVKTIDEIWK